MLNKIKNILFVATVLLNINCIAQNNFEGKIVYELSFPGMEIPEAQKAMMPKEMIMYTKQMHSRMEMQMGMGMSQTTISDGKKKEAVVLMDMMGNKTAIKSTEEDVKKKTAKDGEPEVKITDETKTIAGYKCKKALITTKDTDGQKVTFPAWFTEDITVYNSQWSSQYKGIKGVMMEYEMKNNGMGIKLTAKSVTKESVPDAKFAIPSDYKLMTMEEFQKSMGAYGK